MSRLEKSSKKGSFDISKYGPEGLGKEHDEGFSSSVNISEEMYDEADRIIQEIDSIGDFEDFISEKLNSENLDIEIMRNEIIVKINALEILTKDSEKCGKLRDIIKGMKELSIEEAKRIAKQVDDKIESTRKEIEQRLKGKDNKDNNFIDGLKENVNSQEEIEESRDNNTDNGKDKSEKNKSDDSQII